MIDAPSYKYSRDCLDAEALVVSTLLHKPDLAAKYGPGLALGLFEDGLWRAFATHALSAIEAHGECRLATRFGHELREAPPQPLHRLGALGGEVALLAGIARDVVELRVYLVDVLPRPLAYESKHRGAEEHPEGQRPDESSA